LVDREHAGREKSLGEATIYDVVGPEGLHLTLHDTTFMDGARDVSIQERNTSPERYDTIVGRLRMGVAALPEAEGSLMMTMRTVDAGERRSTRKKTSLEALGVSCGLDVEDHLANCGATAVGTREAVLGAAGRQRNQLVVAFPVEAGLVPTAVYMVTTVLPMVRYGLLDA
jgi:hypothetical protein